MSVFSLSLRRLPRFLISGIAIIGVLLAGCASSPPVQEMSDARQAVAAAQEAGAAEHAPDVLKQAEALLASAQKYLQGDVYWQAKRDAISAKNKAYEALLVSRETEIGGANPSPANQ